MLEGVGHASFRDCNRERLLRTGAFGGCGAKLYKRECSGFVSLVQRKESWEELDCAGVTEVLPVRLQSEFLSSTQ